MADSLNVVLKQIKNIFEKNHFNAEGYLVETVTTQPASYHRRTVRAEIICYLHTLKPINTVAFYLDSLKILLQDKNKKRVKTC